MIRYRGACAAGAVLTVVLTAGPALADNNPIGPREGANPGHGLSIAGTIGLFVLIPAAIFGVITALVLLPGSVRGNRYRPAEGWDAPPVWFAGPPDPTKAAEQADPGQIARGGGSGSW